MSSQLCDGDRVCIVGGGPAGSFAALQFRKLAEELGLNLEVVVFEPHDGCATGPRGCKGCAGILSSSTVRHLGSLGLVVPDDVVQTELRTYVVNVGGQVTAVEQPDQRRRILSVFRGAGPRHHAGPPLGSFDAFLLRQAEARGACIIPARVRRITPGDRPTLHTDDGQFAADLLVLATGVNSHAPLAPAFEYDPPRTIAMAQDEIARPDGWPAHKVAGFFGGVAGPVFAAMVPKGPYLNVSLLYRDQVENPIQDFYTSQRQALRRFFPSDPGSLCGCRPRIVVEPARRSYGERWVAVGDAAVSRLYKDGINSAYLTARAAVRTALECGVSRSDFERGYAPFCQHMAADNAYGELLFRIGEHIMRNRILAGAYIQAVRAEAAQDPVQRRHSRLLWGMLSGDESYRTLFGLLLRPRSIAALARELLHARRTEP